MPLSPISKKRLAKLKEPGMVVRGTFATTSAAIRAKSDANARAVHDALFGRPKKQEGAEKRARRLAIAEADKWFSMFIRLRDSDEFGIATCVTSGKRAHWLTMDCGHYVSRAKQSTRFDERNCHAQTKMSNRFQGGHFVEHGNAIDRIHGPGTAEALRQKGLVRCSRTTSDFLFIAKCYKERVEHIRVNSPNKFK